MAHNEQYDLQLVAGLWITAKATNIFNHGKPREVAWSAFEKEAKAFVVRYGYTQQQFAVMLVAKAASIYSNELKTEIFGYSKEVAA